MTKKELIKKLKQVSKGTYPSLDKDYDQEDQHILADDLLVEYINDPDIEAAFEDVPKWYA